MKRILLTSVCAMALLVSKAQVVIDTVSIGATYANQKWYSLQNDEQGSSPKNNWDIAFDVSGFGSSIHINSVIGTQLWKYPTADTSGWATLDTIGITTWAKLYNSDTSWAVGAFDKGIVISNPFDLGWGVYNSITHIVTGDSLYIIKLSSGAYKKLWIQALGSSVYTFKYADLSGANLQNASLTKTTYTNKIFGYYSLQTNTALDREPASANWDLVFTQYTTFIPSAYTVSGILSNKGVRVAEVKPISNPNSYVNWSAHTFKTPINEIGYDWKAFSGVWTIEDSLIYFVKTNAGDIWKIIPSGFGGSSTGNYIFSKEKLSSVGITELNGEKIASLTVYPNPSNQDFVNIIYDVQKQITQVALKVYDLTGKEIFADELNTMQGLYNYTLNTNSYTKGIYLINLYVDGKVVTQKLIKQ